MKVRYIPLDGGSSTALPGRHLARPGRAAVTWVGGRLPICPTCGNELPPGATVDEPDAALARVRALCVRYRTSDETVDEFIDKLRAALDGPNE